MTTGFLILIVMFHIVLASRFYPPHKQEFLIGKLAFWFNAAAAVTWTMNLIKDII